MRLINPLTGLAVDAEGEAAALLRERGFKPERKRRQPAKQTTKKEPPKRGE